MKNPIFALRLSCIVGLVLLVIMTNPDDPIFKPRRYVHVDELAVAEKCRGQGIGRQLMVAAHDFRL